MIVIDRTIAVLLLTLAVAKKGREHTITTCQYFDHAQGFGDCIVGTGLTLLIGEDKAREVFRDGRWYSDTAGDYISNINTCGIFAGGDMVKYLASMGIVITDDAVNIFRVAQGAQDSGNTWGYAFDRAAGLALSHHTA